MTENAGSRRRFVHITAAGITFQGGSAAIDSSTIIAALVHQLTGSAVAVGAATTILRVGWLSPQLVIGYLVQRRRVSLPYFIVGGFGRATCLALLACLLRFSAKLPTAWVVTGFFITWTAYALVSGIVAVPYNDIVGRSVPSDRRSRLLALRFFGGGVLGLGIAAVADRLVVGLTFPASYAAIVGIAALLMYLSTVLFIWPGEPDGQPAPQKAGFVSYLQDGLAVLRKERSFRLFVFSQWSGSTVMMALPFYIVAADELQFDLARVALLLGAQTTGALAANALWGWWGDSYGKRHLLRGVSFLRVFPPLGILLAASTLPTSPTTLFAIFLATFFLLGALASGVTIAVLGFLMEISPDDRRPAYSGYFNALTAPAYLLPLLGGFIVEAVGTNTVFVIASCGAVVQMLCVHLIRTRS